MCSLGELILECSVVNGVGINLESGLEVGPDDALYPNPGIGVGERESVCVYIGNREKRWKSYISLEGMKSKREFRVYKRVKTLPSRVPRLCAMRLNCRN